MKVLHLYSGNMYGGVETLLITLAQERAFCLQMQPYFALCFEGKLAEKLRETRVDVEILGFGRVQVRFPWTVWKARRDLYQLLRRESFDVVICHGCWTQAILAPVVRSQQLPLVFWCHDTPKGHHWVEKWAKQNSPDLAIANSEYTMAAVPNIYNKSKCCCLFYPVVGANILDRAKLRSAVRTELNTPDDAVVIIQASRMERWKGQTLLLSALAQLRNLPGWVCWIAGGAQRPHESEYLLELRSLTQQLHIAHQVQFLGQRTDVPQLLAAADIHCQPNIDPEPFGIAFVEALYAGLPVVTTALGGGLEIVDESCGLLIEPNDVNSLSEVLRSLILDSTKRAYLAAGGLARAKKLCDPESQIRKLENLLSQVVAQKSLV